MKTKTYGGFQTANKYLEDKNTLNSAFDRQGYLFLRSVLDTAEVRTVRDDFVQELQQQGFVNPGCSDPIWSGKDLAEIEDDRLYALDYYAKLLDTSTTQELFERLFGEPVYTFRSCTLRYTVQKDEIHGSPPHQDHVYIRHTTDFRTFWIPLMEIDRDMGGLALAEGSHKLGLREHVEQDVYSYVLKGRRQKGVALEAIAEPWLTATYRPGDILMFHPHLLHWGTPNRSNKIRLSVDVRVQPASSPRSPQVQTTVLEQRQFRTDALEAATLEGVNPEMLETLVVEMIARGSSPDRAGVRELLAELSRE